MSGSGALITGTNAIDVRPLAADTELVKQIVGSSNNAAFKQEAQTKVLRAGDIVIIPPEAYQTFSDASDHIEYYAARSGQGMVTSGPP